MKVIQLSKNQNVWVTSDTHYHHKNICRGTSEWDFSKDRTRNFNTLEEMNDAIVNNINLFVGENDLLIHLGDWSFGGFDRIQELRDRIKCKNIVILLGNHDHHILNNKKEIREIFSDIWMGIQNVRFISHGQSKKEVPTFVLSHYPIASWMNMNDGWIHLHGHVHLPMHQRLGKGKSLDVGVDGNNMMPWNLDDIIQIMDNQPIKHLMLPQDHHED